MWGETSVLLATPMLEIHRLSILPQSHCSWHCHQHKWNAFVVTSGLLIVEVRQKAYDLTDTTEVRPGELTTVAPGLMHRFRTMDAETECLEVYYPPGLDPADIQRVDVGGRA